MKIGVFYGSSTGVTEEIAGKIAEALGVGAADVHAVSDATAEMVNGYDALVLGSSTWGCGDMQDDWYDGIKAFKSADLKGKKIAIFGVGDSSSYSDTFCDAIGLIYKDLKDSGATFVGAVSTDGYTFDSSISVEGDHFVGLALDETNESDKTDSRIAAWVGSLSL